MNLKLLIVFSIVAVGVAVMVVDAARAMPECNKPLAKMVRELLWPAGAPGAKGTAAKDKPTIDICLPPKDKANGAAVVIFPGGGYGAVAVGHEGYAVARWLNKAGVAAFVVDYRHRRRGYAHPAPLQDAQRAVRIVRARAVEFGVDPARIGVLGFSAGGHLASSVATHYDAAQPASSDAVEAVSCRPDFAVLVYPVISLTEKFTHRGSKWNLLGKNPAPALVKSLSSEHQVTADTPPMFIVHSDGDNGVHPFNSIAMYQALKAKKVSAELHIFQKGRHGYGLGASGSPQAIWPSVCEAWLAQGGWLKAKAAKKPAAKPAKK